MNAILIYGGSFDPPHLGHLNTALNIQAYFHFQRLIFLPCKTPVLKNKTKASTTHRLNMLQQMCHNHPEFSISTLEIDRESPSYMTETLKRFRDDLGPNYSITLLIGMDVFLNLPQWHQWKNIPSLCNLLVINRLGISKQNAPETVMKRFNHASQALDVLTSAHGQLAFFDAGHYPISSTDLRQKIHANIDVSSSLPEGVNEYIKHLKLYCDPEMRKF